MLKRDYLSRLSRAARWRLGAKEAGEVIADYREIIGDPPRPEEELIQELGKPLDAVKPLTDQKAYRIWLALFTVMAVCLLAAALAPTPLSPTFPLFLWYQWGGEWYAFAPGEFAALPLLPVLELLAGTALCLVWTLRRRGEGKLPRSKGLFLCALLALAGIALAWWGVWRVTSTPEQFMTIWRIETTVKGEGLGVGYSGKASMAALTLGTWLEYGGCFLMGVVGMVGLVKARMENRRWAVVYVLALTAAILSLSVIAMLYNFGDFNPLTDTFYAEWFTPYLWRFGALTALGLIGTGVALC